MFPNADDFARAIVAACRETGEIDLEVFADRQEARFRHYALHALLAHFPKASPLRICDLLGCPGRPGQFYQTSRWYVLGKNPQGKKGAAWWSPEAFRRVFEAVEADESLRARAQKAHAIDQALAVGAIVAAQPRPVARPVRQAVSRVDIEYSPSLRPAVAFEAAPRQPLLDVRPSEKRQLADMLREAVANTAALPVENGVSDEN